MWRALSIVDDWSGEHRALVEYRAYLLAVRVATAICAFVGLPLDEGEIMQWWEVLPLMEKPQMKVPKPSLDALKQQLQQRYG